MELQKLGGVHKQIQKRLWKNGFLCGMKNQVIEDGQTNTKMI